MINAGLLNELEKLELYVVIKNISKDKVKFNKQNNYKNYDKNSWR